MMHRPGADPARFLRRWVPGGATASRGVTAQLLVDRGLRVFAEHQLEEADRYIRSTRDEGRHLAASKVNTPGRISGTDVLTAWSIVTMGAKPFQRQSSLTSSVAARAPSTVSSVATRMS